MAREPAAGPGDDDFDLEVSQGPPTAGGRALILITIGLLPVVVVFVIFLTAERGLLTFNKFDRNFRTETAVKNDVLRKLEDAHLQVQETEKVLFALEQDGRELFGELHTFEIPNFSRGESLNTLGEEGRLTHPDFSVRFSHRAKVVDERAEAVLKEYAVLRRFYSAASREVRDRSGYLKDQIRLLEKQGSYQRHIDADDLALDVSKSLAEAKRRREGFDRILRPYFEQ